jgi:3-oxoacyl-[acyl-carrier protein] reductase
LSRPVALVTGASRGIGRAIALALATAGHLVAVNYRERVEDAKQTLSEIELLGHEALAVQGDVTSGASIEEMFVNVEEALGPVSVLVNNAGIRRDGLSLRMRDEDWQDVIATNLYGAFACSRRALLPMVQARHGRIVNVASVAALKGSAGQANYCAAKAGVIGLTKAMALEVASRNVTVNAVAPGLIETDLTLSLAPERYAAIVDTVPAGRAGSPSDVASFVAYLAGDDAGYVTGNVFVIDGGMTA